MGEQKTALALSAGGMFGAYQAGAWKAISEHLRPDLVVGASVGALNGWAIAGGCTPDRLIERWRDPGTGAALKLFPNAGWRNGWFDPEPLQALAGQIASEYQPRIPFGLAVVRLPGLRTELVRYPEATAEHLWASCSIPMFLPSVKIGGRRYIDGGIFEKLPIRAAIEMGATRVIAVDSMPELDLWWLRAGIRAARVLRPKGGSAPGVEITMISPSEPLGSVQDAVFWERKNVERWIALGERDALAVLRASKEYCATSPERS